MVNVKGHVRSFGGLSSHIKEVVITPYEYFSFGTTRLVWVIKGKEHPDPFKQMMWGRTKEGDIVSDYKRSFTKVGSPMTLRYSVPPLTTASNEDKIMLQTVDEYIKLR